MSKTLTEQWRDDPDEILSPDEEVIHEQNKTIERLQEQKQKVIALIKDGRFVEALQELEK